MTTVFRYPTCCAKRQKNLSNKNTSAWVGTISKTDSTSILQLISQDKWDKTKGLIHELLNEYERQGTTTPKLIFKGLDQIWGYLCHVSMTYEQVIPFLKDFYLTLCKHLPN